jgi:hypothetical protein
LIVANTVLGRRIGRIGFGAVLLAGTALLVHRLTSPSIESAHAWIVVVGTWGVAIVTYLVASRLGSLRRLRRPDELAKAGLVLPSVGVAVLMPITIHLPFVIFGEGGRSAFDEWAELSLAITGPTHIALAGLVLIRAFQLATSDRALSPWAIYLVCVVVSCIPYAFLFFIPPALVALTGLPMLALMKLLGHIADAERTEASELPHAIAMIRSASPH